MTKALSLILISTWVIVHAAFSQSNSASILQIVFLTGNTADASSFENLDALRTAIQKETAPVTLLYNGDILHNDGVEKPTAKDSAFIQKLLDVVKNIPNATVYFVPGDEDWNGSGKNGLKDVKKLEALVNDIAGKKIYGSVGYL